MITNDTETNDEYKDGVRYRVTVSKPVIGGGSAAEKRINGFITKMTEKYKKDAENASGYNYCRLKYTVKCEKPLSILFESEKRGKGVFSYAPFAVTFDEKGGLTPFRAGKALKKEIKRFFSENGVRVKNKDITYSYYIDGDDVVVFAKMRRGILCYTVKS